MARAIGRRQAPAVGDEVIDLTVPSTVALPSGREIRKVRAYRDDTRAAGFADDQRGRGADVEPAGVPAPPAGDVDEPPVAEPEPVVVVGEPPDPVGRRHARGQRRWRSISRAERDAAGDIVPGIYP
jgi:hypothetical protein